MEPRPDRPGWLPAEREPAAPPVPLPPSSSGPDRWRRLIRSPRGAAGLAIVAAAMLLWPFSGWSVIPWLIGLGVLAVLRLLRLDGLLRGWAPHVGGLAVVIGLMYSTTPWAWALAASIGVLLGGLVQLPRWKVAAVGAVLCLVTGAGFGFSQYRAKVQADLEFQSSIDQTNGQIAEERNDILPALLVAIDSSVPDPDPLCQLLLPGAAGQILAATNSPDCRSAVSRLFDLRRAAGVPDNANQRPLPKAQPEMGQTQMVIDGCSTAWGRAVGQGLGRIHITMVSASEQTYRISSFSAC